MYKLRLHPMKYYRKIKKVIEWLPLLWKDEDWDYSYLLAMIGYKLSRMRECIHRNKIIAHNEDVAKQILEAEIMIRNIADDPDDEWDMHFSQWHWNKKLSDECESKTECHKTLELSRKRQERNWRVLWKHLDKYTRGWWD